MSEYIGNLWNLIFGQQDRIGLSVNLLIFGLFAIGMIDGFRSLRRLRRERKLTGEADAALRRPGARCPAGPAGGSVEDQVRRVLEFLGISSEESRLRRRVAGMLEFLGIGSEESWLGRRVARVLEFLGIGSEESLLGRRVARVIRLRSAGLGHRDVLRQLTVERIDGYGSLARYIGVTLTLLGLLGTVFGLSQALFSIQGALGGVKDIEGFAQLTVALGKTLEGMKTAFGCTFAGLFTAILLSVCNYAVRRRQSGVTAGLEEFIVCDLLPALESVDPDADQAAKVFANVIKDSATDLNAMRERVTEAATKYQQGSEEMGRVVTALQGTVTGFGESVSGITHNQEEFTRTMSETRSAIGGLNSAVTKQLEEFREFTSVSTQALNARLSTVAEAARDNRVLLESLQTLAQNFQPAIEGYHNQFRATLGGMFGEFKTSLNSLLVEVNQHYKDGVMGQVQNSQQAFESALTRQTKDLQDLLEQNRKAASESAAQNHQGVAQYMTQSQKEMSKLFEEQSAALRTFSDMVMAANLRMGAIYEQVAAGGNGRGELPSLLNR